MGRVSWDCKSIQCPCTGPCRGHRGGNHQPLQSQAASYDSHREMCPRSCMAFTGKFKDQYTCSYSHNGKDCNVPRYKAPQGPRAKPKPKATMLHVPITPIIQAYYANAETSHEMHHRDFCLKQTLAAPAEGAGVKKSDNHIHHHKKL